MIEKKDSEQISRDYEAGEVNKVWVSQDCILLKITQLKRLSKAFRSEGMKEEADVLDMWISDFEEMIMKDVA